MDSSEIWFNEYRGNRYLCKATDEGLEERLLDLAANLWSTDQHGAVSPPRHSENRHLIRRLYAHTIYEQLWRHPADYEFDEAAIRTDAANGYKTPKLNRQISFSPDCFAKFGKKIHLLPALERGNLRIAPASAYADTSLNVAQYDKEQEHFVRTPNQHILTQLHILDSDGTERTLAPEFGELFRYMMVPNFYV